MTEEAVARDSKTKMADFQQFKSEMEPRKELEVVQAGRSVQKGRIAEELRLRTKDEIQGKREQSLTDLKNCAAKD